MTQSPKAHKQTTDRPPRTTNAAILLLLTIADTTWRAFVPTIGGTILGVILDNALGLAPLLTTIMIIVGFATSALLIALQIRSVRRAR
jgi:multisubunit Na+/H+ antiporter MnhC subunit